MTFHETIFQKLLEYREAHPGFNFLMRQRTGAGKRFESGHWFQGNDDYAFVGLINASGGTNRTRSVGISLSPTDKGYSCYLEIVHNEEKDQALIEAYKALAEKIKGVEKIGNTKYSHRIGDLTDEDFSDLFNFLDQNYKLITSEFTQRDRNNVVVSDEKFQKLLERVNRYRLSPTVISTNTKKMQIPLNQILYGPPGTGKTYALQNEFFELFTISKSSLSKEQFTTNLVADLTWWQTFAITLYDSGRTTVSELINHEIVRSKAGLSSATNIRPIAWSRLQAHTVPECKYVKVSDRSEPALFVKEEDSTWRVVKELVENLYPEGIELLNKIKGYKSTENESVNNYEFVTFHQSFTYEDFVEGIKPNLEEGRTSLDFEIRDGIFKSLCLKADKDRANKYAIFIDEINRGNVSAIFGELITLIEEDKRLNAKNEIRVKLPYSKKLFGVPPNLYIIGTMNTADRSVEALDTALRRRFAFKEIAPDAYLISPQYSFWKLLWDFKNKDWDDEAYLGKETSFFEFVGADDELIEARIDIWDKMRDEGKSPLQACYFDKFEFTGVRLDKILKVINNRIQLLLDDDHKIGHSYFFDLIHLKELKKVFANKILPLLQEYFFGDFGKIGLVLGSGFVEVSINSQPDTFFAPFEYDEMGTLLEKKVYTLKDVLKMDDTQFLNALNTLLGQDQIE